MVVDTAVQPTRVLQRREVGWLAGPGLYAIRPFGGDYT